MQDNKPEEDKLLHTHEWMDLYNGSGFRRGDVTKSLVAFFCKWCLQIRVRSFDQTQYNLNYDPETMTDFRDNDENINKV